MGLAMRAPPHSLRLQLMAAYVLALLLTAVAAATFLYFVLAWRLDASTPLTQQAKWLEQAISFNGTDKPAAPVGDGV